MITKRYHFCYLCLSRCHSCLGRTGWGFVLFFLACDLLTKWLFVSLDILGPTPWIHAHRNTGMSFGMPLVPWVGIVLLVVATVVVGYMMFVGKCDRWFVILFWAGGWGNGIDRIVFGAVRDFFVFPGLGPIPGFIFNIADVFLSVSLLWLLVYRWKVGSNKQSVVNG